VLRLNHPSSPQLPTLQQRLQVLSAQQQVFQNKISADKGVKQKQNLHKLKTQVRTGLTVGKSKKSVSKIERIQAEKKIVQAKIKAIQTKLEKRGAKKSKDGRIQKSTVVLKEKLA